MRTWLFYKATPGEGETQIEFRRVQDGNVSNFLPDKLRGIVQVPNQGDLDRTVQALVRSTGWVGDGARPADSEVAQVILQGRW